MTDTKIQLGDVVRFGRHGRRKGEVVRLERRNDVDGALVRPLRVKLSDGYRPRWEPLTSLEVMQT